jgi:hypothetical protein
LIGVPHFGQREPGKTIDFSSGIRVMQTFRKLPMIVPKRKINMDTMTTVESAVLGLSWYFPTAL